MLARVESAALARAEFAGLARAESAALIRAGSAVFTQDGSAAVTVAYFAAVTRATSRRSPGPLSRASAPGRTTKIAVAASSNTTSWLIAAPLWIANRFVTFDGYRPAHPLGWGWRW